MLSIVAILTSICVAQSAPSVQAASAIQYLSRDDAQRRITTDSASCELRWFKDWQYNSEYRFLFTNHSRGSEKSIFRAYLRLSKGYALIKQLEIGNPEIGEFLYFDHFSSFWWTQPVPPHEKVPLIWIQEVADGSGHLETGKYFFTVAELPPISEFEKMDDLRSLLPNILQEVEYLWPPEPFKMDFKEGESWRRGHDLQFDKHQMTFRNEIYPSGPRVYGTFKLVAQKLSSPETFGPIRVSTKYRIETDSFRRGPIKPTE